MFQPDRLKTVLAILRQPPQAEAALRGSSLYPELRGRTRFYQTPWGVLTATQVRGLPTAPGSCGGRFFALHIHQGGACGGTEADPFADAGSHYDPGRCPHPDHAGDLPPLLGAGGQAFQITLTDRFSLEEILGKTVILHSHPDDFTTQPAGDAGQKIACGVIRRGP